MKTYRFVLSSGRKVFTSEEDGQFFVIGKTGAIGVEASGPFKANDTRFSEVRHC